MKPPAIEAAELAAATLDLMKRWDDVPSAHAAISMAQLLLETAQEHLFNVTRMAQEIEAAAAKEEAAAEAFRDGVLDEVREAKETK